MGLLLVGTGTAACGGNSTPSTPTSDITGTWTEVGGVRTWTLTQVGIQAGGPASFSQNNNPNFGAVSGTGGVTGLVASGTFTFAETYEQLSLTARPNADCYVDVNGQVTVGGSTMTGSYTEVDACAGVHLGQITGRLTMQRK